MDAFSPDFYLARTRRADALVYLDFDGVIQYHEVYSHPKKGVHIKEPGRALFEWAHYLEALLQPHPEFRIVLSTSWARRPGFGRAKKRLPERLQERVIGATFHRRVHGADLVLEQSFASRPRGEQVWADVQRREPLVWCALDDDGEDWPGQCREHLVLCKSTEGLSDPETRLAVAERFARMASEMERKGPTHVHVDPDRC